MNDYSDQELSDTHEPNQNLVPKPQNFTNVNDPNSNFKVVVRVRPPLNRELMNGKFISTIK